jgi:hypothetical protein
MENARGPLGGFNTNLRHDGRLFHVQTEDLGVKRCVVETQLFVDGGQVLSVRRSDYESEASSAEVTRAMKAQHKAMLIEVRDGVFDPQEPDEERAPEGDSASKARTMLLVAGTRVAAEDSSSSALGTDVQAALRELVRVTR